jgi:energy-coupling factor transporter ATP-binding protein EcfA2
VSDDTSINTEVSGGTVGVAGAQVVQIREQTFVSNYYGSQPQPQSTRPIGPLSESPYPGLFYFGPLDAARFFGREQAIQALLLAVAKQSFTMLVGASGSGKSSVVLAGLAPLLEKQGGWRFTYFRIGTELDKNPFAALARALTPLLGDEDIVDRMTRAQKLANSLANGEISLLYLLGQCRTANPGKRILLIADQFEEVFTLLSDEKLRDRLIDTLIEAFPDPGLGATPDVCLVVTLRADFYNAALHYRRLADRLQDHIANLVARVTQTWGRAFSV